MAIVLRIPTPTLHDMVRPKSATSASRRITYIVTSALTATHLLRGQLSHVAGQGFETSIISSPGAGLSSLSAQEGAAVEEISIRREIAPLHDLYSLWKLWRTLRRLRPDCVNASTPKAALLGLIAARALGIPIRIYTIRGLRLETARGFKRWLLTTTERIALRCASDVICVSSSLRQKLANLDLAPYDKVRVLASGSSNGVDYERFSVEQDLRRLSEIRQQLGLRTNEFVIGFVGRLTRDKGIADLLAAFDRLLESGRNCRLLVIGDPEGGDPLPAPILNRMREDSRITLHPWARNIEEYYPLMNVLAFPSYREGFPNAPLEAACASVPTVAYRVTGSVDAIADNSTGCLVERGDAESLAASIDEYIGNPELRDAHGSQARQRAFDEFRREIVWQALTREYERLFLRHRASSDEGSTE